MKDIGTSDQELHKLMVGSHRTLASKWLKWLRDGCADKRRILSYLLWQVEKGGFTLADIGTDEAELSRLVPDSSPVHIGPAR